MKHGFKAVWKYTYHRNPYTKVAKNTLLYGTWNNVVVNEYKDAS